MNWTPWLWMPVWGVIALAFWGFLLWLAWTLVTAVRGIHEELGRIRVILGDQSRGGASGLT